VGRGKLPIINYSGGTEISGGIVMGNVLTPMKPCAFSVRAAYLGESLGDTSSLENPAALDTLEALRG
jgi:acetyl-CoA synthetase